jgi:hypothetical protein
MTGTVKKLVNWLSAIAFAVSSLDVSFIERRRIDFNQVDRSRADGKTTQKDHAKDQIIKMLKPAVK